MFAGSLEMSHVKMNEQAEITHFAIASGSIFKTPSH